MYLQLDRNGNLVDKSTVARVATPEDIGEKFYDIRFKGKYGHVRDPGKLVQ